MNAGNPQSRRIAAVSAFKCNMAASIVAGYMWVFPMFGKERSIEAAYAPKKERKQGPTLLVEPTSTDCET